MIDFNLVGTKYAIHITSSFRDGYKKIKKEAKIKINYMKLLINLPMAKN